ncbi:hypothetical protein M440DRAFT_1268517 [Trichoderma longibrachiatum ATCC 18648]|uniref:Uncharacterized protein n=1 Tax=Trichoderma longibrachiatum ATCC 18648 TaxID=983965 RepID=A0A2T4C0I6_TRILO|nr:hypothetical protein M440DRAFT_1268517 [Trichoderma longibrachiatum ATCC 18648]
MVLWRKSRRVRCQCAGGGVQSQHFWAVWGVRWKENTLGHSFFFLFLLFLVSVR